MHRHGARTRGFTIIELLVVIGIIALLVGMLVPALAGAIDHSRKRKELNSLRQVGVAWTLYANASKDSVLPGFMEIDLQRRWNVSFEFPTRKLIPPSPDFGAGDPNIAGPWTWRLLPYLSYNHEAIHGHLAEPEYDASQLGEPNNLEAAEEARRIAYNPSFGYNGLYVGGWWSMSTAGADDPVARCRFFDSSATVPVGEAVVTKRVNVVSRSVSSISRSSDLVVFCSSSHLDQGVYRKFDDNLPGFHLIVPPWVAGDAQWSFPGASSSGPAVTSIGAQAATRKAASGSADPTSLDVVGDLPADLVPGGGGTAAPIGRYNRLAATLIADGHTQPETPGSLVDMRRWIDAATTSTFTHD